MRPPLSSARFGGWILTLAAIGLLAGDAARAQSGHRTYFVGTDGIPILTNRPQAYRANPRYEEIRIAFEPIVITGRYNFSTKNGSHAREDFLQLVRYYANANRLDENVVFAVIKAESAFDPRAVSKAGAQGLMQLMPGTAAEMNVIDPFNPEQNIAGGTQYLAKLIGLFDNNLEHALAAYNAGPGAVRKYGGVPPYKETREYVKKVQRYARDYARGGLNVRLTTARADTQQAPDASSAFIVHYKSGATQPADSVREEDLFYVLEYGGRKYLVRKKYVERVVKNA